MSRRAAVLLPYAVFLLLAAVSWNRWIEPFVDTGRELMVPWRVSRGEALYRDVRFYYGPLAPWLAAVVDSVVGRLFAARIALGALVAVLHLEALRRLAGRLATNRLAPLATSLAVAVAFFLRPGGCHLFPYSLDTSIAVAAATGALLLAAAGGSGRRDRGAAACLLAALLSRPEIGFAALGALAVERLLATDAAAKRRLTWLAVLPVLAAATVYAAVSIGTPGGTLTKEGWLAVLFVPPEFRNVYASFAGLDRPGLRSAELGLALFSLVAVGVWLLLAAIAAARLRERSETGGRAAGVAAIAALVAVALVALRPPTALRDTLDLLPPLVRAVPPLLFAAAIAGAALRLRDRSRTTIVSGVPDSVLLLSLFFAARLFLAAGYVGPYDGFYLPLPVVVAVALLVRAAARVPARIDVSPRPATFPGLVAASLAVFLAARIAALALAYRNPAWSRVATPAGSIFVTEPVAGATRDALADLSRRVPGDGSIAGFPEAGFFNWVLGRTNPLAEDQFFPGHLDRAAEEDAIARLRRNPPDAVVFVNVRTAGHGRAAFGKDYLEGLDGFVRANFRPAAAFGPGARGNPRIGDPGFFIEVRVPAGRARP
ncbi:MAG TPA: hypothetical protein VGA31_03985 [Thermoanaerobaculia bacterium]